MTLRKSRTFLLILGALLLIAAEPADAASWNVIEDESRVEFSGNQMGVPTTGEFQSFTSEIDFDIAALTESTVSVVIDVTSVTAPYPVLAQVLKQEPWFNVADFPNATITISNISKVEDDQFNAAGTLTLRGITQPLDFAFSFTAFGPDPDRAGWSRAVMTGETTVQRTTFGVGQGEWGDTSIVADDVIIRVQLTAEQLTDQQ
jgi:polyisoprenoid-binding protein YceI